MGMAPTDVNGSGVVLYLRVEDVDPYLDRAVDDQGFTFHIWRPAPGY